MGFQARSVGLKAQRLGLQSRLCPQSRGTLDSVLTVAFVLGVDRQDRMIPGSFLPMKSYGPYPFPFCPILGGGGVCL